MTLEERLNAQDAITRLIFAYCTGIDSGRLDDMARLFANGTWYLNPDTAFKGFEEVSNFLHENVLLYDRVPGTRHVVSNLRIDLADDGQSANTQSYVIVYQTVEGSAPQIIFQGAYDDTFSLDDGLWHFDERHILTDGIGDMSKHLKAAQPEGSTTLWERRKLPLTEGRKTVEFRDGAALITGGASGIGRATAKLLAEHGVKVAIADIDETSGNRTVDEIVASGGKAIFVRTDVTSAASVEQSVDTTVKEFGSLRYAFNNAGTAQAYTLTHEMDERTFDKVFALNAKGVFLCMKAEITHMLAHGGGAIVNTASGAGTKAVAGMPAYVGSKHAVIGLTRNAAIEYVRDGIRVNAIAPGTVTTPMITTMRADQQDLYAQAVPLGRLGTPEEIARTAAFLLSEHSSFTTGTVYSVDGGFTQKQ